MRSASLLVAALVASLPAAARAVEPAPAPAPAEGSPPTAVEPTGSAPAATPPAGRARKPLAFGVWGALPFGEHLTTALTPSDAPYQINEPDRSYALGIVGQYDVSPSLRVFFDGGLYRQSVKVAKANQPAGSFWVYEQSGYTNTSHSLTFDKDMTYFMDTTALRLGAAWVVPLGSFDAWVGATLGVYAWQATYGTDDRKSKWGQTSATVTGATLIMGADMPMGDLGAIGLFLDLASPAAEGEIHDLFYTGWTWKVAHHVMGPYRFGVRLLF
ncbi:MAG TPA: hypothetical protein VLT47_15440 [Anaeromyxobacteraceae bacterium]|nr:hypothetical protein [Anaeromyxobacteraceae bacterium]